MSAEEHRPSPFGEGHFESKVNANEGTVGHMSMQGSVLSRYTRAVKVTCTHRSRGCSCRRVEARDARTHGAPQPLDVGVQRQERDQRLPPVAHKFVGVPLCHGLYRYPRNSARLGG